jgi:geranylgeranyl diphosphate synthase type II
VQIKALKKENIFGNKLLFSSLKKQVNLAIKKTIQEIDKASPLKKSYEYALITGGKRLRPILVLLVADAIGLSYDVMPSALAVEFFHTASLIADDLPCMDNEEKRRNKATVHKLYGESASILVSYSLISDGYKKIAINAKNLENASFKFPYTSEKLCVLALQKIANLAGISGATNGQYLDLFPPDGSLDTIMKIIYQKTVSLFEISFILGWLFGGGDPQKMDEVSLCSQHFGVAFQIADDLLDLEQDKKNLNSMNIAIKLGQKETHLFFKKEMNSFHQSLKKLDLLTPGLEEICNILYKITGQA